MGKLNENQRATVGSNCVSAAVANKNKNNVIVYCNDKNAGLAVKGALSAAYPSYEFSKEEVGDGLSTWEWVTNIATLGGWALTSGLTNTWKVFTVKTRTNANASKLVAEINSCIAEYAGYGGEDYEPEYDPEGQYNGGNGTGSGYKKKDYTAYVVIGVAVSLILLLLLWKK